jgi:hypothetical protein
VARAAAAPLQFLHDACSSARRSVSMDTVSFEGHPCVRVEGAGTTLFVPTDMGPRILGLIGRGQNLLAVLPDAELERPGGRPSRLIGGHRLWAAPRW